MGFLKKPATVEGRLAGIKERIGELEKRIATRTKDLEEAKATMAARLGDAAMTDSEEAQQAVTHARKSMERTSEALADLKTQLNFLRDEQRKLALEYKKVTVADAITKAEAAAASYNGMIEKATIALTVLKELHRTAHEQQTAFHAALKEREYGLRELGIQEPTVLKVRLGTLSEAPSPHTYNMDIPDTQYFSRFVGVLMEYAHKKASWEEFQKNNPDWKEKEKARAMLPPQPPGFGDVGSPRTGFGNNTAAPITD